ncbi:MAG: FecR family protein [Treponema sp.]|nr:FecR family protein [Treponema sp.]
MQKKARLRLRDFLIVIICSGVCAASIYMFWKDLNSSSSRKDKDQIAKIEFKRKIAQRKYNDRVVWERLQQNSPLYDSDTIRTADGATAKITFEDGTVLDLHENTMIQVSYTKEKGLTLSVNDGNIELDTTASSEQKFVSLAMENGSVFKLDKGSKLSAATNSSSGDNSFKLQAGNATVTNHSADGSEQAQVLTSGETVKVASSGEIKKEPLTVTSISSDTKLLAFNQEKSIPVLLKWTVSGEYEKDSITVETSFDKDFSKIQNTYSVKNKNEIKIDSPVGRLYWRVYPQGQKALGSSGRITVEAVDPVVLKSPVRGSSFSYHEEDFPAVQLAWSGNDYAEHYHLEVSASQDLSNPIISDDLTNEQFTLKKLGQGTYYWRITPYYKVNSIGDGKSSTISSFSVEKLTEVLPPKLSIPAHKGKLTFSPMKVSPVTFQWKSDAKSAEYKLEVAKDQAFKDDVYEKTTKLTRVTDNFTLESLPQGTYYWRVVRTSPSDKVSVSSDVRTFRVEEYVPGENKLVYPPDAFAAEKEKLLATVFSWKLAPEYNRGNITSIFQISSSTDFKQDLKEIRSSVPEVKDVSLNAGSYYWRVAIENPLTGELIYTSPRSLSVLNPLARPNITSPLASSTLTVYGEGRVRIAWAPVRDADYYKVKIYGNNNKLVKEISSTRENFANISLPPESYKGTVQAFSEETEIAPRRSSHISEVNFTIRGPEPVHLVSPANNASIQGLTALRSPTVLVWRQGDKIARSEFVLRKRQANGTMKVVKTINNPRKQISLERLEAGNYQWTIRASSAEGIPLDAQETYSFEVRPVPELASPRLVSPSQTQVIDSEYLKKNRNISFDWADVAGATDYKFTLYYVNSNGSLKRIYEARNLRNSEVKIKDLSILDIGDFEWNVTAYVHARDGFEEQSSKAAGGNFKIQFELPGKIETIDPGKLYGE